MTAEERLTELEDQISKLQAKQTELHKELRKAQIEQWQGRLEDLEVQVHLGTAEASDRLTAQMEQLRAKWADARRQLEDTASTASSIADTIRAGLEKAFKEVRNAILESRNQLK